MKTFILLFSGYLIGHLTEISGIGLLSNPVHVMIIFGIVWNGFTFYDRIVKD